MDLWALSDLATPWCLHVAVTLGVPEQIAAGREEIGALARAVGADAGALERVLRQLVNRGMFEEPEAGRFRLNDAARILLEPGMRAGFDLEGFGGRMAHSWSTLLTAVRTGRPAYREVFGREYWEDLEAHPEIAAQFDLLMGAGHRTPDPDVLGSAEHWRGVRTVVDVGGGTGSLLAEVLRAHPEVRGTLVDLPRTVARAGGVFAAAGVADRASVVGQSFFEALPAGADLYLLKSVICDWPDAETLRILRRCAEAARPAGRVVVVNGVTGEDRAGPDLLMLVLVGGKERTLAEFTELAREAGLAVTAAGPRGEWRFVVECRPI